MAPGMFIVWGWHCLQPAQQHAHPSPHARSKIPWVQETSCPDAFTAPHCPTTTSRCHPTLSLVSPKFLCPHSGNAAESEGKRPQQVREWRRRDATTHMRLAGLVPGLPHPILVPGSGGLPCTLPGRHLTFSCHVTCHCEERVGCLRPAPPQLYQVADPFVTTALHVWMPGRWLGAQGGGSVALGSLLLMAMMAGLEFLSIIVFQGWLYYLRFVHVTL